jgi:hypothetical protein
VEKSGYGLTPIIIYALWCGFFAFLNYIVIERLNERVRHGFNGLAHLTACLYFSLAVSLITGFIMLLIGRLFFDVPLNLFRKRPFDYVPDKPRSIVDKVEKYVFRNDGYTPKVIYAYLIFILILIQ